MTETLQQTAQRLMDYNNPRIDLKRKKLDGKSIMMFMEEARLYWNPHRDENRTLNDVWKQMDEAYAALAVLDGSIPVWRDVSEHEPPTDDSILACRQASGAQWILNYNTVKRTWMIAGTNQSVVFTHWKPLHQPPKEAQ
jgi:hypothetical protein